MHGVDPMLRYIHVDEVKPVAFCKHCGTQTKDSERFCAGCGAPVSKALCSRCGTPQTGSTAFCSTCGYALLPGTHPAAPVAPPAPPIPIPARSRKGKTAIVVTSVACGLAIVLMSVWVVTALSPGIQSGMVAAQTADGVLMPTEKDYKVKAQTAKVTEEQPAASFDGAVIDFGIFNIDGEQEVSYKALPVKEDKENGVRVTAYDFTLSGRRTFDDVVTITLPYKSGYAPDSVGARYYNDQTAEWESVPYEVDAQNNVVRIFTTHLSTYGVFEVDNEKTRAAYITHVYRTAQTIPPELARAILEEYTQTGAPGPSSFEAGLEITNGISGLSSAYLTTTTLGGAYGSELRLQFNQLATYAGVALAVVQLASDLYTGKENRETATNLTRNIIFSGVSLAGTAAMQLAFVGVYVIDYSLTSFGKAAVQAKLDNIDRVYRYYNENENKRSLKQWRQIFIDIYNQNPNDPNRAKELMDEAIDSYCNAFWDYPNLDEIAGVAGYKTLSWPSPSDIELLTKNYKHDLIDRLYPVFTSLRNYVVQQINDEYNKRLDSLQRFLNQRVDITITEKLEQGQKPRYAGYTIRFAPLAGDADARYWTGKLGKDGSITTFFTRLGHLQCGSPDTIELYEPGDIPGVDKPILSVPFEVQIPKTTVILSPQGITLDELVGTWDTVTDVGGFDMPALDGLMEQMQGIEGMEDYLGNYLDYDYTGEYPGTLTIEKTGANTALITIGSSGGSNEYAASDVTYSGVYDSEVMTMTPNGQVAGGTVKLTFSRENGTLVFSGGSDYSSEIVNYNFQITGTKR